MERRIRFPSKKDLFNRTTAAVLTGVVTAGSIGGYVGYNVHGEDHKVQVTPTPEVGVNLDNLLNSIAKTPLFTPERRSKEFRYFAEVLLNPTLSKIDKGLWVTSDPDIRIYLLNQRYALRQKEEYGLKPLPPEMLQWIKDEGINPETLAIARDNYKRALNYVQQLIDQGLLRDDNKKMTADEALMNPGGMAELIAFETGGTKRFVKGGSAYGFSNIGEGIALDQINDGKDAFPNAKSALKELVSDVSKDTDLDLSAVNIQGSLRGDPKVNLSGGCNLYPIYAR